MAGTAAVCGDVPLIGKDGLTYILASDRDSGPWIFVDP